jgi:phenylalanyl-tRNA synthetase beta chain
MKISYQWLKQYIDIPETAEEIGHVLTNTGLEVESVEPFETVKGGLKGLVIGEVLTCSKHPNADKLSVSPRFRLAIEFTYCVWCIQCCCRSKSSSGFAGINRSPYQRRTFTIKATKIRGEVSEGMICAEDEIGLGESHDGIMVLKTDTPNGTAAATFFNIETDYVLEIGLTPNRADAASHIGVARDIKASRKRSFAYRAVDKFKSDNEAI